MMMMMMMMTFHHFAGYGFIFVFSNSQL